MNLSAALAILCTTGSAWGFVSPEHRALGERGATAAFTTFHDVVKLPIAPKSGGNPLVISDGAKVLVWVGKDNQAGAFASYGELVAIYGDYRGDVPAMLATTPDRLRLLQQTAGDGKQHPELVIKEGVKYLLLASLNQTHFSSVAVATYQTWHQKAIDLAADAAQSGDGQKLWLALHYEALACHSLTDLFAPGHDFVDRRDAVQKILGGYGDLKKAGWTNPLEAIKAGWESLTGIAESYTEHKYLHDQFNTNGSDLQNLRGESWRGYGDDGLGRMDATGQAEPAKAVEISLTTLFTAYESFVNAAKSGGLAALRAQLRAAPASYEALTLVPVQFRRATYFDKWTTKANKTLCDQDAFCDFVQRVTVENILQRKK
jgi:hypothetical protein